MSEFVRWENELYHHGILGQKWGVRRFQNEDGTWTKAGLRQRAKLERYEFKQNAKTERARLKEEKKRTKLETRKRTRDLTDEELKKRIDRLNMEKEYKELRDETSGITSGKRAVKRILEHFESKQANKLRMEELKMKDKELAIREKEITEKTKQSEANARQAEANARQAEANARQAEQNKERDKINRRTNRVRATNERKKIKMLKKYKGTQRYRDFVEGRLTMDQLLGLSN